LNEHENYLVHINGMEPYQYDEKVGSKLVLPAEVKEFTDAYMLENNPVGAWLRQHYTITGRREDVVQKSELYKAFLADTGFQKTLKAFSEDIKKCNVNDTKNREGTRFFYGIVRKEQVVEN
jgi:hypothetical protein